MVSCRISSERFGASNAANLSTQTTAEQLVGKQGNWDICDTYRDLARLCRQGRLTEAVRRLGPVDQCGIGARYWMYARVIQACAMKKSLEHGKQVHYHIIKSGFKPDVFLWNNLLSMYMKCRSIVNAHQVFDEMPTRDVVSWTTMISGYAQQGYGEQAFYLFGLMQQEGLKPDKYTFSSVLHASGSPGTTLEQGKRVHALILEAGLESNIHVATALIRMYTKYGSLVDGRHVFDRMLKRDVVSWTMMIVGYAKEGYTDDAFKLFYQMDEDDLKPDKAAYISILTACVSPALLEQGKQIHCQIIEDGLQTDFRVANALISMYVRCGSMVDAHQIFDNLPQRDVVSWTAIIGRYSQQQCSEKVFELFQQMLKEGVKPDKVMFMSVLNACASPAVLKEGKEIHALVIRAGFEADTSCGNALVSMYSRCGSVEDAQKVFDKLPRRDAISWTAMISACAQHGLGKEAINLFWQMEQEGVKPDKVTFNTVLNACASLAVLDKGRQVHACIIKAGFERDVFVGNALVDMYSKAGSLEDARQAFDNISLRDVVSWSTMILAYAQHGHGQEALQLFEQMQQEGVKPDLITFMGVLSACSNVGLVDEGQRYFQSMSRDHALTPTVEHYGCMVDILGRAGCIKEVQQVILEMPVQPDSALWGSLLAACKLQGNVEVGEWAAENRLKLEPQNAGTYILLSNIYAAARKWDDVAMVRKVMEFRGLTNETGQISIEVNDRVHDFVRV
jgi:pentatricopeptide repeat protein